MRTRLSRQRQPASSWLALLGTRTVANDDRHLICGSSLVPLFRRELQVVSRHREDQPYDLGTSDRERADTEIAVLFGRYVEAFGLGGERCRCCAHVRRDEDTRQVRAMRRRSVAPLAGNKFGTDQVRRLRFK